MSSFALSSTATHDHSAMADVQRKIRAIALASAAKLTATRMPMREASTDGAPPPSAKRMCHGLEADLILKATTEAAAMQSYPREADAGDVGISYVQVPADIAGYIIGKKGVNIKKYETHYGVILQVSQEVDADGMKTISLIGGSGDAQAQVSEEIISVVEEKRVKPEVVETYEVPEKFVGDVVGKKGQVFKSVEDQTATRLDLCQDLTPAATKVLTIRGFTAEAVGRARHLIEVQLLAGYRRVGIFNAALETKLAAMYPQSSVQGTAGETSAQSADQGVDQVDLLAAATSEGTQAAAATGPFVAGPPNQLGLTGGGSQDDVAKPMEVDASSGVDAAYFQAVSQWAAFYAREPTCVAYYMSLRSQAAQAFCSEDVASAGA